MFYFFCILGKGLICCGDDKGSLWLYNLPQFGRDSPNPALKTKIDVSTRLMWPELQVSFLEFTFINSLLKFIYSEKATNFCKISTVNLSYVVMVKFKMEISQNFVAFSECINFNRMICFPLISLNFKLSLLNFKVPTSSCTIFPN